MQRREHGFTVVEVLVVLGILAALLSLSLVNLGRPQAAANSSTTLQALVADLKSQQLMAMSGGTGGTAGAQAYGVYIQSSQFVLFTGSSYSPGDPNNFIEPAANGVTLSATLPGSSVIFQKGTGDVQGFTSGSNAITLAGRDGTHTITINRFGGVAFN